MTGRFYIAGEKEILEGGTTDVYFANTMQVLESTGTTGVQVVAEFTLGNFPRDWRWGIFAGLEEVIHLLEGKDVTLYSLPEGTVFRHRTQQRGVRVPVMVIEGAYGNFCVYETPALGLICHSSGIATMAARCRIAAKDRVLISFGIRRMHPALSPMIDRYAFIGGCDAVSSLAGAKAIGEEPKGTMPHALIITLGDQTRAFQAFDRFVDRNVSRIALVDTYCDEKMEALMACKAIKNLVGVRLDTPGSRRGSFKEIVQEVRWEMDIRGYQDVKIVVSGGINDQSIPELRDAGVWGFGVGTSISNAPTIDFAMDIVEKEGEPAAKRGKFGGKKHLYHCPTCHEFEVSRLEEKIKCTHCGKQMQPALKKYLDHGKTVEKLPTVQEIRNYVLSQLEGLEL